MDKVLRLIAAKNKDLKAGSRLNNLRILRSGLRSKPAGTIFHLPQKKRAQQDPSNAVNPFSLLEETDSEMAIKP
ncbi:hypothetical protein NDU88_001534 [Pleurodeles waltl]|uniref:Uncharacterized protein n=1 Tax=Pleurodeles waltl TaxID=8319 RepID=A0AAV7U873_PLEWA|nr:hypothetical protein NDU88_001534 [Pleurodeles waltl]